LRAVDSLRSIRRAARHIFIALCVIATGAACSTIPNNSVPPLGTRVVEAPDYNNQGGTWRYRVEHKMFGDGYRSDMDQGEYEIQILKGKYRRARIENGKRVAPPEHTWLHGVLPLTSVLQNTEQYYSFPLWVGKQWNGMERIRRWHDIHCTVTGIEIVTTPAGTFETYRIVREMFFFAGAANYYDTYIYYYSPDTRSIVKYEYKREFKYLVGDPKYGLQETASYELLSYKPEAES
jgi:hypothetical protein